MLKILVHKYDSISRAGMTSQIFFVSDIEKNPGQVRVGLAQGPTFFVLWFSYFKSYRGGRHILPLWKLKYIDTPHVQVW